MNGTLEKIQRANQPDIATLQRILQFLLPTVGRSFGSSSLLSLLSLDWADAELHLGLQFENLWEAELTCPNIVMFFFDCLELYDAAPDVAVVEELVISAMHHVEPHKGQQWEGRFRLYEIVNRVLDFGRALDWVSVHGGSIARVFTSGPTVARNSSSDVSARTTRCNKTVAGRSKEPRAKRYF
jgi:hypothetical protein